ncbi:DUF2125 domain-containing protein [Rhodobacterales bacterium HKCCE4037]|nr:DUF2125 domain-containing protein [Rhodobacterales bacterium HKCCE4037]
MTRFCFSLSTLAIVAATPAFSQTLATDIWAEWQAQAEMSGQTISATVTETDTGLTLTNFTTLMEDEDFSVRGAIDEIQLIENPDGTLSMTFSELYSATFTFDVGDGDPPGNIEILMEHEGLDVQVSGDPGNRTYNYSADRLMLSDGAIWGGGAEPPVIDLDLVMTDLASTYSVTGDTPETMRFESTGSAGGMQMSLELSPPAGESGYAKAGIVMGAIEGTSSGTLLSLAAMNQGAGTIPEGFELNGSTSYESFAMEFQFEDTGDMFAFEYGNDGGSIGFGFNEAEVSYDIAGRGMQTEIRVADLPIPVQVATDATEISLAIPLAAGEEPQDMSLRIAVENLVAGDGIWAMMDPTNSIPRDPASLVLDATGQVRLFMNLLEMDPEEMDTPPGELRALNISELRLGAGGAELTGTAELTFAPNQLMPIPVGAANLQLSGGNALLDALMAGGLLPAEQGAFVRGMVNVFARPGAAPDTLETTVEFGADGSITANGIPLQ